MDPRLLRAYNDELAYLRAAAQEFGREHDVAGYLGLKTPNDPDPYVERLLEGVAFLAARVNLKLHDQFPEFTQHLLDAVQPNYLAPTPSMCVVALEPKPGDAALAEGVLVPRHTEIAATVEEHDTPVRFATAHDVTLLALEIEDVEYLSTRASVARFSGVCKERIEAGLRIRFRATGGLSLNALAPGLLPVYLQGTESVPGELYRQLIGDTVAVMAEIPGTGQSFPLPLPEPFGFADEQALLPHEGRTFRGYRLLSEYFACPERFLFAALRGLDKAFAAAVRSCDVVFLFRRSSAALTSRLTVDNFRLHATPAINLFRMQLGRVAVSPHDPEHAVVPDRTRPLDYEVFRVLDVVAHGGSGPPRTAAPLYALGALLYEGKDALHYVTRIRLRRLSTLEQRRRRRTDYIGTETLISLTSPENPGQLEGIRELAIRAWVTNREMPELIRVGGRKEAFTIASDPVASVDLLRAPTRPRPALGLGDTAGKGDTAWRVIGHLTPNYTSLAMSEDGRDSALKDHLALYCRPDDTAVRRQIDGILSVTSEAVTRRIPGVDRLAFARGRALRIRLDDASFENGRMFLFVTVLNRFLAEFCSINSFVETFFHSPDQGEFARWPLQEGRRPTI